MLPLARGKERTLLALLLVHRNEGVPVDRIIDERRHLRRGDAGDGLDHGRAERRRLVQRHRFGGVDNAGNHAALVKRSSQERPLGRPFACRD
jgi:hypothetical protein